MQVKIFRTGYGFSIVYRCLLMMVMSLLLTLPLFSLQVARDQAALRDGPEVFFDALSYLKKGTQITLLKESEDGLWLNIKVGTTQGWIAASSVSDAKAIASRPSMPMMGGMPKGLGGGLNEVNAGSYVAAVKGFAEDYVQNSTGKTVDINRLLKMTEFNYDDYKEVRRDLNLKHMPRRKDFLNKSDHKITSQMEKIGLAVSMAVLQQGVVENSVVTRKINVIANILNRQTRNYDTRIRCWILPGAIPAAYSAPAGYLFFSEGLISSLDNDYQLVAIIAHEIGHLALGHGMADLEKEQIRNAAVSAAKGMDALLKARGADPKTLNVAADMREAADYAFDGFKMVRDDKEELEADAFAVKLLKKNRIKKKFLIQTLERMLSSSVGDNPRYNLQLTNRINEI